uniref:Putative peptidoglycan recognition protein n=2 Tax=Ixodes ricinus TaxID=34613 RepID=V5ICZ0_IXORI
MTSIRAAVLSCVLLVLETTADEGAPAASAKISQRSISQRAPTLLDERRTRDSGNNMVDSKSLRVTCPEIPLVSREEWGAQPPSNIESLNVFVKLVFFHHTEGDKCYSKKNCSRIVRHWQKYHQKTKGWFDIGYQYLVGGDGSVYEGRRFGINGAHTLTYNNKSVSIAFIGNFTHHAPSQKMLTSAQNLIDCGVKLRQIQANYKLHGQRDANRRDCPGNAFYNLIIKKDPHFGDKLNPYIN